jgi:competence protein ComEA
VHPGLYRVPDGSRVAAAVEVAGGPSRRADLAGVNLAAPVQDGQQIVVPVRARGAGASGPASAGSAPPGPAAPGSVAPGATGAKVSLSTATVEQLDGLDGIGPTLAQRIIEYRDAHGGFRSVDELREVEGIGEKRFESLRDAVQP